MPWVLLGAAIATEVASTLALRGSDGFNRPVPSIITVVGYVASFVLLAIVLKSLPVGIVYAIWSAVGIALVAVFRPLIFYDRRLRPARSAAGPRTQNRAALPRPRRPPRALPQPESRAERTRRS